jgi:Ca2+/Na+ antiporter
MKEKFAKFMQGRYGIDNFSRFLLAVAVACMLCSALLHAPALNYICWILLFCLYFRMFSKNIKKRCEEERMYMEAKDRLLRFCKGDKSIISDSKTHKIYRCPQCRQKIRVPRGKGKIEITCPTCRTKFIKRT